MIIRLAFAVSFLTLSIALPQPQETQNSCSFEELNNPLQPNDPAYVNAMALAMALQKHGVTIRCIGPSTMARLLPRLIGAAVFRTSSGDFEALFRPKDQNFDDVLIRRRRDGSSADNGDLYNYTFRDRSGHILARLGSRELFFVRNHNALFLTWGENTAVSLKECFRDVN